MYNLTGIFNLKSIEIYNNFTNKLIKGCNMCIENIFRLYYNYLPFETA